jgi:biopolymer transport protein ExbD
MASKKLRASQADPGEEMKIDMSPMIDMVFLLLIFFLVNATLIVVKMDKKVTIPIAKNSKKQEEISGRIVINVYGDEEAAKKANGRFRMDDGTTVFENDKAMVKYIEEQKELMKDKGYTPRIHLRGDKDALFKYNRRVIRSAAAAGVNEVIFVSYGKAPR